MNLSLFQLIGKYIMLGVVTLMSYFNVGYSESKVSINNNHIDRKSEIVNSIAYNTVVTYNNKVPRNITNIVQEGSVGLSYKGLVVQEATNEVIEKGIGAYGIFKGRLVGYGPDCKGCSGEGYLSCKTQDNKRFSLKYDGIYYTDSQFGQVRILAANLTKFPCGTIVKIEKKDGTVFTAIVMDKLNTELPNETLMDLAYASQTDSTVFGVDGLTGKDITFNIQRWGW